MPAPCPPYWCQLGATSPAAPLGSSVSQQCHHTGSAVWDSEAQGKDTEGSHWDAWDHDFFQKKTLVYSVFIAEAAPLFPKASR